MPEPSFKIREEYERRKTGRGTRTVMRVIGWVWFMLACLTVGAMVIKSRSPFSLVDVGGAIVLLGGPGLLLVQRARDLRNPTGIAWISLALLPISIALFAGYGCFVLLRTFGPPP